MKEVNTVGGSASDGTGRGATTQTKASETADFSFHASRLIKMLPKKL